MTLTHREYTTLTHVLHATKMDCWFYIKHGTFHGKECDYCHDLENDKNISLKEALSQAMDGFIDLSSLGISEDEIHTLDRILYAVGLIGEKELGNTNGIKC